MNERIYLSPPDAGASERQYLLDAFDSNWIAPLGPHVDAFEREFAAYVGMPHAVALCAGTVACAGVVVNPDSSFVGTGAMLGIGTVVKPGVRIGAGAVVGAGSVVIRDVPDGVIVIGAPAKPLLRKQ